jgi:hypothetical protein
MPSNFQTWVTIISAVVAIISAVAATISLIFANRAVKTAEKTYTVELIGQIYAIYQSEEMLRDLKLAWDIYREIWIKDSEDQKTAIERASQGKLIRLESAITYFKDLEVDTPEFRAIHNTINFWTYLELMLKKKAISPQEITAFTSPKILGLLSPMAKAYDIVYSGKYEKDENLVYTYEVLEVSPSK